MHRKSQSAIVSVIWSHACSGDLVCICYIAGIQPGLIRISTGITGSLQQRMQQLVQAVQSVKPHQ
jgi:hypothetical protein